MYAKESTIYIIPLTDGFVQLPLKRYRHSPHLVSELREVVEDIMKTTGCE